MADDKGKTETTESTSAQFMEELLTLPCICDGHFFTIPDYQRGYAWDEKHVKALLKDIDHLINDGVQLSHYTGTLVLSPIDGKDNGEFYVVDGQQRLTTLVIFMRLLIDKYPQADQPKSKSLYIERGKLGNTRTVLCLNSDHQDFFERVVLGDGNPINEPATLEAHERLLSARELISNWISERIKSGVSVDNIRNTVETELGFLVYAPAESAETGIMFEVINNRGKPLSELEKVKNYLIYCCVKLSAPEYRRSIDKDWSIILHNLNAAKKTSSGEEDAFLRYCVAVHFKLNKKDSQYGYDQLKKQKHLSIDAALQDDTEKNSVLERLSKFVDFLRSASLWYARLYGQQHEGLDAELVPVLNLIRAQESHASIMPLFLSLVIKHNGTGKELVSLLELVEKLNFRVYMARNMTARNDTGQGELYKYASGYFHDELIEDYREEMLSWGIQTPESEEEALEYCLTWFINKFAADARFRSSFVLDSDSPDDFYWWPGIRYFLMNYEMCLQPNKTISIDKILLSRQEGKPADYLSVEHIWAKENRNKDGENNRKIDLHEKRRLGNFVLLDLRSNIQNQNDFIDEKFPRYLEGFKSEPPTDLEQVRKMAKEAKQVINEFEGRERYKNYYWGISRELNTRLEKQYIDFAEKRWSIKQYIGYDQLSKVTDVADEGE